MSTEQSHSEKLELKRSLQFRYSLALGIVATVMFLTFGFLIFQIGKNEQFAYVINVSGKQRMFSQRIALFAHEVQYASSEKIAESNAARMQEVISSMRRDHLMLRSGSFGDRGDFPLSPEQYTLYEGNLGVNDWVERYFTASEAFLDLFQNEGLIGLRKSNLIAQISAIAGDDLPRILDKVVGQYQYEAESQVSSFKRWEAFFLCFGLLVLAIEARYIFRPMVTEVVNKTTALERVNGELTEFSYRISHDLRAPIVSSRGLIKMVKKALETGKTEQAKTAASHIDTSLSRLENLIGDMINLSRAKLVEVKRTEVFLEAMLDEILGNLANVPNFERLAIKKDIDVPGAILVQEIYLKQTIENLISNAVKYQNLERAESFVSISAKTIGADCVISIRDNGIGIPEDSKDKLFQMFARFHPKVSFGSGLGLYLVKQNVSELDGEIDYIPQEDGTEFRFQFPLL